MTLLGEAKELIVKEVTYSQGLSENTVMCINQDSLGYIWVGTREGLNRYDGYSCDNYYPTPNKQGGLRSGAIQNIFIDKYSKIWIKHSLGIDEYMPEDNSFQAIKISYQGEPLVNIEDVVHVGEVKWLATSNWGLVGIHPKTNEVIGHYGNRQSVESFCIVDDERLWTYGSGEISLFNISSKEFEKRMPLPNGFQINGWSYYQGIVWIYNYDGIWILDDYEIVKLIDFAKKINYTKFDDAKGIDDELITSSVISDNKIWFSTDGNGIYALELKQGLQIENIRSATSDRSISVDANTCLFSDRDQNLWIGTVHNGLNMIPFKQKGFRGLKYSKEDRRGPYGNYSNFLEDKDNQLWAASFDGLCQINQQSMQVEKYVAKGTVINAITIDWEGDIYLGSYNKGLLKYCPAKDKLEKVTSGSDDLFKEKNVKALLTDHHGNIWIGSSKLYCYDKHKGAISLESGNEISSVNYLLEDKQRAIWIGTFNGLFRIDYKTKRIERYAKEGSKPFQLTSNWINCLYEDKYENIWVGTNGGGLNVVMAESNEVHNFSSEVLSSQIIHGIAEDKQGHIWFTTNSGLVRMKPENGDMKVFNHTDGLINNQYIDASMFLSCSGRMLCGGEGGIDYFYPSDIKINPTPPDIIITATFFETDNNEETGELKKQRSLVNNDTLIFKYNQSSFGFGFAGIDYANPEKIQYAYMLEGFNSDWEYVKDRRTVNYGHVNPGEYTFKVRAANSDGIWSSPSRVVVIVKPPFSKTPLAYFLYLSGVLIVLFLIYRYSIERRLLKNRIEFEHNERQRIEELNQLKLRLFTHISHEFRTPLSLIIAPIQELIKRFKKTGENAKELEVVQTNANKLKLLVNQVLEVRKIESEGISIIKSNVDIIELVNNICTSFKHWAKQKNIALSIETDIDSLILYLDKSLIEKVIYNLLSNAIKYTNSGFVQLQLKVENDFCRIDVVDSGIGISQADINRLFEMFFRVENNTEVEGSGIGLALSKEMVELHEGQIGVESKLGKGSRFIMKLPLSPTDWNIEEEQIDEACKSDHKVVESKEREFNAKILLVDDNLELREYLADKLSKHFIIIEAENGVQAVKKASEEQPELILSDVMMPEMDGWELCQKLKSDVHISHIPIILLTALNESEHTIKGLELGADAYLSKPFNVDHVLSLIKSILHNRRLLKAKYKSGKTERIDTSQLTELDKQLLNKAQAKVVENMNHPDFSVQVLSDILGMSRVNLHMKLKALCDLTPSDFIMQIRLKEALSLLKERTYPISEVADMTGFSTASHFSRSFKKEYGGSPSEFLKGQILV